MRKLLLLFIVLIIFMVGGIDKTHAQSGPKWLGTKRLPAKFLIEVVKGNVAGHSLIHIFGKADVGTTFVPIASSLKYPTPTTATALEFVSDNANDTAEGTGAREITIVGLDSTWSEITQVIDTNGLTAVDLPIKMIRVYRWWVSACGTYATSTTGSHAGTLTLQEDGGGALWFNGTLTPYPKGQSEIAGYTVPVGFRALIFIEGITADSTKSVDVMFLKRLNADNITAPFTAMRSVKDYVGVSSHAVGADQNAPIDSFPAKTDLLFMAKVASGTAGVSIDYELLLIADGY